MESTVNKMKVGDGNVILIAGGGKVYTDIAARFCRSEKSLIEVVGAEYNAQIVKNILDRGHYAATEFDFFIFGVEGYSRVTEIQLVRKRIASYLIKSGRCDKVGKRNYDVVIPGQIDAHTCEYGGKIWSVDDILELLACWYNTGVDAGLPEEWLRFLKPQATEFKALIGMNAHGLIDWFKIRLCKNAQAEIRDMAWKMYHHVKGVAPDLFQNAGPGCMLGYCPENSGRNKACSTPTLDEVLDGFRQFKGMTAV